MKPTPKNLAQALKTMAPQPEVKGTNYFGGRAFKRGALSPEQANAGALTHRVMAQKIPEAEAPQVKIPHVQPVNPPVSKVPRFHGK